MTLDSLKATNTRHTHAIAIAIAIAITGTLDVNESTLALSRAEVAVEKARNQPKPRRPSLVKVNPEG